MWEETENKLVREFKFKDFTEAFSFMVRVAMVSEKLGHHPSWYNNYHKVRIELSTHDAGDVVTDKDRELASKIDGLV
jgi:4a-hydroxytetrahydrobiopterin dehydratase